MILFLRETGVFTRNRARKPPDPLAVPVSLRLNRKHTSDPIARVKDDCGELVKTLALTCELDIPNAVSPMKVTADLQRRTVDCSMSLNAPKDKKGATARLNWLLRQLKKTETDDIFIRAYTMGRGANPQVKLGEIRENPDALRTQYYVLKRAIAFMAVQ